MKNAAAGTVIGGSLLLPQAAASPEPGALADGLVNVSLGNAGPRGRECRRRRADRRWVCDLEVDQVTTLAETTEADVHRAERLHQ